MYVCILYIGDRHDCITNANESRIKPTLPRSELRSRLRVEQRTHGLDLNITTPDLCHNMTSIHCSDLVLETKPWSRGCREWMSRLPSRHDQTRHRDTISYILFLKRLLNITYTMVLALASRVSCALGHGLESPGVGLGFITTESQCLSKSKLYCINDDLRSIGSDDRITTHRWDHRNVYLRTQHSLLPDLTAVTDYSIFRQIKTV